MEILDVIIDNHGLIYKVQTQNGHVFETYFGERYTSR